MKKICSKELNNLILHDKPLYCNFIFFGRHSNRLVHLALSGFLESMKYGKHASYTFKSCSPFIG